MLTSRVSAEAETARELGASDEPVFREVQLLEVRLRAVKAHGSFDAREKVNTRYEKVSERNACTVRTRVNSAPKPRARRALLNSAHDSSPEWSASTSSKMRRISASDSGSLLLHQHKYTVHYCALTVHVQSHCPAQRTSKVWGTFDVQRQITVACG